MAPTIAGLILAGGQSRRMGDDKALLLLPAAKNQPPRTLLANTCSIAQSCTSHTYVLTSWPDRYARLLPADVTLLTETKAGAGPMSALLEGWSLILADTQHRDLPDWLLLLACDLPELDSATLKRWSQSLAAIKSGAIAALPQRADRWEPLCGFYHRRCLPKLELALSQNISSFQRWLRNESVIRLPVDNFNVLRNCNTPAQWQQFLHDTKGTNP